MRRILVLLLVLIAAVEARGDAIELADGRRIQGTLAGETDEAVEILASGVTLRVARANIRNVIRESPAMNALRRAAFELKRDRTFQAYEMAGKAAADGVTSAELRAWCVEQRALIFPAAQGAGEPGGRAAWRKMTLELGGLPGDEADASPLSGDDSATVSLSADSLSAVADETLSSAGLASVPPLAVEQRDFILAMAETLDGVGDTAAAAQLIGRLSPAELHEAGLRYDFLQPLLLKDLREALDRPDFARASTSIRRMEAANLGVSQAACILLYIRWSAAERRRGDADLALRILYERLRPLNAVVADEFGAIALTELRQSLAGEGRYSEAVDLFRKWGPRFLVQSWQGIAANLYRDWGADLLAGGKPSEAKKAFEECQRLNPEFDPTQIRICEFEERFLALRDNDWASAFELGQWAAEQGLISHAIRAYERAAPNEDLRGPAEEQIAILRESATIAHYERCLKWFESGDPERALLELDQFPFFPNTRRIEPEIEKLRSLCWVELDRRSKIRGADAEVLFQNAHREYFLGKAEDAVRDLNSVIADYGDTSAAGRAREFLRYIEMRRKLSELEGLPAGGAQPGQAPGVMSSALENEIKGLIEKLEIDGKK